MLFWRRGLTGSIHPRIENEVTMRLGKLQQEKRKFYRNRNRAGGCLPKLGCRALQIAQCVGLRLKQSSRNNSSALVSKMKNEERKIKSGPLPDCSPKGAIRFSKVRRQTTAEIFFHQAALSEAALAGADHCWRTRHIRNNRCKSAVRLIDLAPTNGRTIALRVSGALDCSVDNVIPPADRKARNVLA